MLLAFAGLLLRWSLMPAVWNRVISYDELSQNVPRIEAARSRFGPILLHDGITFPAGNNPFLNEADIEYWSDDETLCRLRLLNGILCGLVCVLVGLRSGGVRGGSAQAPCVAGVCRRPAGCRSVHRVWSGTSCVVFALAAAFLTSHFVRTVARKQMENVVGVLASTCRVHMELLANAYRAHCGSHGTAPQSLEEFRLFNHRTDRPVESECPLVRMSLSGRIGKFTAPALGLPAEPCNTYVYFAYGCEGMRIVCPVWHPGAVAVTTEGSVVPVDRALWDRLVAATNRVPGLSSDSLQEQDDRARRMDQ